MALTPEEMARITEMLDEMDKSELDKLLASFDAFVTWLQITLIFIYMKIKNALKSFWKSVRGFFS